MVTDLQICSLSDHPEGSAGNAAFPDAAPINATGWSNDNSVNYDRALFSSTIIWSPGRRQPEARRVGRCEGYRHRGRTQWIDRRQVAQGGGADRGSFPGSPLPSVWDACQCKLGQIIADLDGIFIHTIVLPPDMPGEAYTISDVTEHHDVLSPTLTV
jgi:hypothetical protein